MPETFVAVLMGSDSDMPVMQATLDTLKQFQIPYEVKITSAHRTPQRTLDYVQSAEARGCKVFICAAGLAAHLGGVVAAHTIKPVIGVPLCSGSLGGLDALLSTVQMPPGVPVATVAVDKPGAKNAGILAVQMLALEDSALQERLEQFRADQIEQVVAKEQKALQAVL